MCPIVVKGRESISIPEGKHRGKITNIEQRVSKKEGYEYLDVHVSVDGLKNAKGELVSIKYGAPFDVTNIDCCTVATFIGNTKLGKLLMKFGVTEEQIKSGESIDVEKFLKKGRDVQFMTKDEETDRGTFARIVEDTLKPA